MRGSSASHALFWLLAANGVGLLAACMLLWPGINEILAPFTYGRWLPLHLNFHLYGWISFPLIGLLYHLYEISPSRPAPRLCLGMWSVSLAVGGLFWLMGQTSGKLFLDWKGFSRLLFALACACLWVVLAHTMKENGARWSGWARWWRWGFLVILLPIPFVMYASASGEVYPPVNPNSGGATGTSLLGSSLGMVGLFLITPLVLAKPRERSLSLRFLLSLFVLHGLFFAVQDHGNSSNHDTQQILALASLLPWVPLLVMHFSGYQWPKGTGIWLWGFALWGGLLTLSGWLAFLPDVLIRWKFTNALVAHAHLAMAGMVSSFLMLVLLSIEPGLQALGRRLPALIWQVACLLHVIVLLVMGSWEELDAGRFFQGLGSVQGFYLLRLVAGAAMFLVSLYWYASCRRSAQNLFVGEPA